MTRDKHAVRALRDIMDPLSAMHVRAEKAGHILNTYAFQLAKDPEYIKGIAREALLKMGRKL